MAGAAPTPLNVIPAKAGIQGRWGRESTLFAPPHPWIPAFAGMTFRGGGAVSWWRCHFVAERNFDTACSAGMTNPTGPSVSLSANASRPPLAYCSRVRGRLFCRRATRPHGSGGTPESLIVGSVSYQPDPCQFQRKPRRRALTCTPNRTARQTHPQPTSHGPTSLSGTRPP